jgi:hypothetical protein
MPTAADRILRRLPAHWLNGPLGDALNRSLPAVAEMGTPDADRASVEVRRGSADAPTVIAFAGMAHGMQMPVAEFAGILSGVDVNVLFVKDFRQCWYQRGVRGLGRSPEQSAEALRTLLPAGSRLAGTLGMSSGGTAAILFGALMGAPHVLAFSPRTWIDRSTISLKRAEGVPVPHFRVRPHLCDSVRVLVDHPGAAVEVHVGAGNEADMIEAHRLDGIPGVTVVEHPISEHTTATYLRDQGVLREVVAEALGLT